MVRGRKNHKEPERRQILKSEDPTDKLNDCKGSLKITHFMICPLSDKNQPMKSINTDNVEIILESDDLDDVKKEVFTEISQLIVKNAASPTTPHRIELCESEQQQQQVLRRKLSEEEEEAKLANVIGEAEEEAFSQTPRKSIKRFNNVASKGRHKRRINTIAAQSKTNDDEGALKSTNTRITDFFPVRRSERRTGKTVLAEKQRDIENGIRRNVEVGLAVQYFEGKGRGIVASKRFEKGDFVVEYHGDLICSSEAKVRETKYAQDKNTGCYMYYFKYNGVQYCVDATEESGRLGRLVNHSRHGNLITRTLIVDGKPRLVLVAKHTIEKGEEVTYDYGDRSKESLQNHPWLAN